MSTRLDERLSARLLLFLDAFFLVHEHGVVFFFFLVFFDHRVFQLFEHFLLLGVFARTGDIDRNRARREGRFGFTEDLEDAVFAVRFDGVNVD